MKISHRSNQLKALIIERESIFLFPKISLKKHIITNTINIIILIFSVEGFILIITAGQLENGSFKRGISFIIFAVSMVLVFISSAFYHSLQKRSTKKLWFRRIDHSAIFLMIAAGYTPLCLMVIQGVLGTMLLIAIWLMALIGILMKFSNYVFSAKTNVIIYVIMGWILIIAYPRLIDGLGMIGFLWLIACGIFFTIGAITLAFHRLMGNNRYFTIFDIFHLFIVLGTASYVLLLIEYI